MDLFFWVTDWPQQCLEMITKQIELTIGESISEIQKEEKKLIHLIGKSYEHLTAELKYSFDCNSIVMDMPYVRKPSNVDSLIKLRRQKDEETKQLMIEINDILLDCQMRLDHIDQKKEQLFSSLSNYTQITSDLISSITSSQDDTKKDYQKDIKDNGNDKEKTKELKEIKEIVE